MEGSGSEVSLLTKLQENTDLFGDNSSSSESDSDSPPEIKERTGGENTGLQTSLHSNSKDGVLSSPDLSSKSRKKKKACNPSCQKSRKLSKAEANQIHRDSQRIIRESSLNLPQYTPRVKTLDSFLNRLKGNKHCVDSMKESLLPKTQDKENTVVGNILLPDNANTDMVLSLPGVADRGVVKEESCKTAIFQTEDSWHGHDHPSICDSTHLNEQIVDKKPLPKRRQTQKTLTSLLVSKPQPSLPDGEDPGEGSLSTPSSLLTHPLAPPPQLTLQEGHKELCFDVPTKELTDMEKFQQRLLRHMTDISAQAKQKTDSQIGGVESKETLAKLRNKPGAVREEWKIAMRKQVSQISQVRAQEQKVAEMTQKMYEEEEEEEEEMTDTDTSDEEFLEEPAIAAAAAGDEVVSDACSDLDEDSGREAESDSDNERLSQSYLVKKKPAARRVLDSDDDDNEDGGSGGDGTRTRMDSSVSANDFKDIESGKMPLLRLDSERGGMTPLRLDSEGSDLLLSQATMPHSELLEDSAIFSASAVGDKTMHTVECSAMEKVVEMKKRTSEVSQDGSADGDSLEFSLQWGKSLPLAQPCNPMASGDVRKNFSPLEDTQDILREESQWQATPTNVMQSQLSSQCMEEETQFLDADGFLCIRKEKVSSPCVALFRTIDPSLDSSPSELLGLCSGQFPDMPPSAEERNPPDGGKSSQDVRKLLGLPQTEMESGLGMSLSAAALSSGIVPSLPVQQETDDNVCSDSEGETAVLRWAQRHQSGHTEITEDGKRGTGKCDELENIVEEDKDMPVIRRRKMRFTLTKEERLTEFVESEAELSGEDVGSDVDEEDLLYADEYEQEEGDELDISQEQLWDQVNKAHLKQTFADDKADLMDFKERFLKEGDLYEDGLTLKNGFFRTRHFMAQGSEAGSLELFSEGRESGEEEDDGTNQAEVKRRQDRLEREEFIRKCKENEDSLLELDGDSQTILSIITDTTSQSHLNTPVSAPSHDPLSFSNLFSAGQRHARCNSFLKSIKSTPSRRYQSNSKTTLPSVATPTNFGATTGKGFIFQKSTPAVHKHTNVVTGKRGSSSRGHKQGPTMKRTHFERPKDLDSVDTSASIFSLY